MPILNPDNWMAGAVRIRAMAKDKFAGLRGHAYIAARNMSKKVKRIEPTTGDDMLHEDLMVKAHKNFSSSFHFLCTKRKEIDAFDLVMRELGLSGHVCLPDSETESAAFSANCPDNKDPQKIMLMLVGHKFEISAPFKSIAQPSKDSTRWLAMCHRASDGMTFTLQFNVPGDVA